MSEESRKRHFAALDVLDAVRDDALGFLEVGSVAYAPENVTTKSDLDLVAVLDFPRVNFQTLYRRLGRSEEPGIFPYANSRQTNTFSIVWNHSRGFEVGLHLWDSTAFQNVATLAGPNKIFAREHGPTTHFVSTAVSEVRYSLTGEGKRFVRVHQQVDGGRIVDLHTHHENESGFYPGLQMTNLILSPVILHQKDAFVTSGIVTLDGLLREKIEKYSAQYGKNRVSVYNAMPPKVRGKMPDGLRAILSEVY